MDLGRSLTEECSNLKRKSFEISSKALFFLFFLGKVIENGHIFGTVG